MKMLALLLLLIAASPAWAYDPFVETGIDNRSGTQIPDDAPFVDQAGRTVTLAEIGAGKPLILIPVLHDCPNICGVTLEGVAQAIKAQGFRPGRDFTLIAFGIDPRENRQAAARSLAEWSKAFPELAATGGVFGLTGSESDIHAVTDALGYRYSFNPQVDQYAHLAATAVLTADGKLSRWLYGLAPSPTDLRLALTEAGEGRIGNWTDAVRLLCYHYDPVTGRYGTLIWSMLRIGGSGMVVALAGFIGIAVLRERRRQTDNAK
ncbi:SCO family protein [Tianweitania sp.]|uniref:SCO family protein n=1 Tax=Tianweitania sp. TaxID=2021634 RepID=UPI00289BE9B0|nr:SCO family protein [Tianweitania sp.]